MESVVRLPSRRIEPGILPFSPKFNTFCCDKLYSVCIHKMWSFITVILS